MNNQISSLRELNKIEIFNIHTVTIGICYYMLQ